MQPLSDGELLEELACRVDRRLFESEALKRRFLSNRGLELRMNWQEEPAVKPLFTGDPAKLELVLANLLADVMKFSGGGPSVEANMHRDADELRLSVADRGVGIASADHAAIFERFCRRATGLVKGERGHGLGLSIVKAFLELQGGTITVASAAGRGSSFTVVIPEITGTGEADVFAAAGNEFFFDA